MRKKIDIIRRVPDFKAKELSAEQLEIILLKISNQLKTIKAQKLHPSPVHFPKVANMRLSTFLRLLSHYNTSAEDFFKDLENVTE